MKLEDLQPGAAVGGLLPNGPVEIVSVQWHGSEARSCARSENLSNATGLSSCAWALDQRPIEVAHIHADGGLESDDEAMERLLRLLNVEPEGDLFRKAQPRDELVSEAIALQARPVAYVDRNVAAPSGEPNP